MPAGTVPLGSEAVITVSTTSGGTFSTISDLDSYDYDVSRSVAERARFQNPTALQIRGSAKRKLTLSGMNSVGDTGQALLKAAAESGAVLFVKVLPDGTNGAIFESEVASVKYSGKPEDAADISFELTVSVTPTDVGTGLET
jgi:hypothetical protein